jgi:hypothetical protein
MHENIKEITEKLSDPVWRINNLYYIKDAQGNKVKFKMNDEQMELFNELHYFNIIPKARQLGITTFFCILYFDQILFNKDKTAGIIAHTREHAKKIFKEKIKFAWDNLPDWVKTGIGEPQTETTQEMTFPNGSTIFVSTSARSGTVQYLHISEFGFTCQHFPDKAEEIVAGSINTVHAGQYISIESTAEGKEGYFYEFCMEAKQKHDTNVTLSELEFKYFFFPWYGKKEYSLESATFPITSDYQEYFRKIELECNIKLSDGQKRWYIVKKNMQKDKIFSQYPSTVEEAFSASIQGAYYANEIQRLHMDKRLRNIPIDDTLPVDTWWDLGMNDDNVIIFTQSYGAEIRIIDVYSNSGEGLAHYIKILREKGYRYGYHTLPHDVEVRELGTGVSRKETLTTMGMTGIRVARKASIHDGIEKVRSLFSRFYFDEVRCEKLIKSLSLYRKEWDDKLGVFKDKPRHDTNSHYADAVRVMAVGWMDGGSMSLAGHDDDNEKKESDSFF